MPIHLLARLFQDRFLNFPLRWASVLQISEDYSNFWGKMSYMRGDLLTRTRKLVKGMAKPAPAWLKAMEQ